MDLSIKSKFYHLVKNLLIRLRLWYGAFRRSFFFICRRGYIEKNLRMRTGECRRCGVCCQLIRNCPYLLFDEEGNCRCRFYNSYRFPNCRIFPIDQRDIDERNLIASNACGFRFGEFSKKQHNSTDD